jgi:dGTPase
MKILDFVSGMTDSYALELFKNVRGISLPGHGA